MSVEQTGAHTPRDAEPDGAYWHERDGAVVRAGGRGAGVVLRRQRRDEPRDVRDGIPAFHGHTELADVRRR